MTCRHWWKIETPDGPTVHGMCKLCGEEKDFPTSSYRDEDRDRLGAAGAVLVPKRPPPIIEPSAGPVSVYGRPQPPRERHWGGQGRH